MVGDLDRGDLVGRAMAGDLEAFTELARLWIDRLYAIARLIRVHPMNARTIGLETGIQNGPLAIAVIIAIYLDTDHVDEILLVPALYSLFIVIVSTLVTFWFRRANLAEEQKIPNLL